MGLVAPCHRCKNPPRDCRCFDYFAEGGTPAAVLPGLRVMVASENGWYRLSLALDADVTQGQIRGALPNILAWRDGLRALQGLWVRGGRGAVLEAMHEEQATGRRSYAGLADLLNFWVAEHLQAHRAGATWARPDGTLPLDIVADEGLERARELLGFVGIGGEPAEVCITDGLEALAWPGADFRDFTPITAERVRRTLRTWREKRRRVGVHRGSTDNKRGGAN